MAGAVGERAERVAQALVARPAEAGDFAFAGLDRDGGLAGVAGERVAGGVAGAAVADLRQQRRGGQTLLGSRNSERKISPSGCSRSAGAICRSSCLISAASGLSVATSASTSCAAGLDLGSPARPSGALRSLASSSPGACGRSSAGGQGTPPCAARRASARRPGSGSAPGTPARSGCRVREQADRRRPEALKLGAQLVAQRHARLHQILAPAAQRPQRLGLIAVGLKHPEAVMVGARQLAQHERVEPVGLAARGAEPRAGGRDLVGMQRQHPQPGVQQPLDQQPVRAARSRPASRSGARAGGTATAAPPHHARTSRPAAPRPPLLHEHVVLLRRPIDARVVLPIGTPLRSGLHSAPTRRYRCGRS